MEDLLNITTLLSSLRRRWWIPVLCLVAGATASMGIGRRLPRVYRASTLVLVEPQKIPVAYVRPTVTTTIEDRLRSLQQQITSRSRVERVIKDLNLFEDLRETVALESLVGRIATRIQLDLRGGNTFRIIFTGTDPKMVADVANKVADLVIEDNSRARQQEAQSTSKFLEKELELVRIQLENEEAAIAQFKRQHMGELPEQRDANLRTLEGLQQRLRNVEDSMSRARDRRVLLESQFADLPAGGNNVNQTAVQLEQARTRLEELESRYTAKHPDVEAQKREIAHLQALLMVNPQGSEEEREESPETGAMSIYAKRLQTDISGVEAEIRGLQSEEVQVRQDIVKYQARVENAPRNEAVLSTLTRDYDNLAKNYQSLLNKKLEAEMAEKLEHERQGEQFTIVDRAIPPRIPFQPNMTQIFAAGSAIGFIIGCALAISLDLFRPRFRSEEELAAAFNIPVLAAIPRLISEEATRKARRIKRLLLGSGVAVVALATVLIVFLASSE